TAQAGHRVKNVWVDDKDGKLQPLHPDYDYRFAINSYTFGGGEGYDFSHAKDVQDTGNRLSIYFHDYLAKHKHVSAPEPTRIIQLAAVPQKPAMSAAGGANRP